MTRQLGHPTIALTITTPRETKRVVLCDADCEHKANDLQRIAEAQGWHVDRKEVWS